MDGLDLPLLAGPDSSESPAGPVSEVVVDGALRLLFERSADASFLIDGDRLVDCNQAAIRMLGCRGRQEVLSARLSDLSPPFQPDGRPSAETVHEMIATAFARGSHGFEWTHLRADGSALPVQVSFTAIPSGERQILYVVWHDITVQKRAEAVSGSQERAIEMVAEGAPLAQVLDFLNRTVESQSSEGVISCIHPLDIEGQSFAHTSAPSLPPSYADAVNGTPLKSLIGPCCYAATRREAIVVPDLFADSRWGSYWEMAKRLGLRSCWSTPILSSDCKVLGTFANYYPTKRDPSPRDQRLVELMMRAAAIAIERDRAQETLRDSEARFRQMANHAPGFIWLTRPDGSCGFLSKSWYEFTGQTEESGLGDGWLTPVHPNDRREIHESFMRANAKHEAFKLEYRLRGANGEYRWFIDAGVPSLGPGGQFLGYIGSVIDITERKLAEEALRQADRLQASRLAMMQALFTNVSHEFRTPLTLLLASLEEALSRHQAGEPQDVSGLGMAHRNAMRLLKMVNSLLELSRIESGRSEAIFEPVDLAAYTAELISMFDSAMDKAGLRLRVDCPSLPEPVYVDREMWEKVVLNLLSNAFKFTFQGEIAVSLRQVDGHAELAVRDTGVGIIAGELEHVFERFHRVPEARGRTHEGTGIGLALVHELAKLHGGTARATSRLGKGSTFTISIPLGRAHLPPERISGPRLVTSSPSSGTLAAAYVHEALSWLPVGAAADSIPAERVTVSRVEPSAGPRQRIVLAEDNADMRRFITRLLRDRWDVEAFSDGEAALAAVWRQPPDLVLTDVMMPRLDGFELLRALRTDPATRTIPGSCSRRVPARSPGSRGSTVGPTTT